MFIGNIVKSKILKQAFLSLLFGLSLKYLTIHLNASLVDYLKLSHTMSIEEVFAQLNSYLLPELHPIKTKLDKLFMHSRALLSVKTMHEAGFLSPFPRKKTRLIVTKHPDFPGVVFKVYLDEQVYYKGMPEYFCWILRIQGADKIRKFLEERNLKHYLKYPKSGFMHCRNIFILLKDV